MAQSHQRRTKHVYRKNVYRFPQTGLPVLPADYARAIRIWLAALVAIAAGWRALRWADRNL